MSTWVTLCLSLYRRLAQAFPHEFRMIYGDDLDRLGEDAIPEVWRQYGAFGLVRLLVDIGMRLPVEYLSELRRDIGYAFRVIAKSPGYAAVSIVSLALGIGVCSVYFSEINAMVFRPIRNAQDPGSLVALDRPVSYPYFERYREQSFATAATAFTGTLPFGVALEGSPAAKPERVSGEVVSPEYFSALGMEPAMGRFFRTDTEKPGTAPAVVLSDRFWRSRLGADPNAVGRTLRVNGHTAAIIGVAPEGFLGVWPRTPADIFLVATSGESIAPELGAEALQRRDLAAFHVVLRLASGVKLPVAEAALDTITRHLNQERPKGEREQKGRQVHLISATGFAPIPTATRVAMILFGCILMGLVLSLACSNLATLLLARASDRRKEIAIRLSVGASRFRLVRQLLTESVILSLAGGAASLVFVWWLTNVVSAMRVPGSLPVELDVRPDYRVFLFTFAIAALAGLACGLAPALAATRTDLAAAIKQGAAAPMRAYRRFGLRNFLMVYQVAGSLALLLVTGFMVMGYGKLSRVDPGFDTADLYLFSLDPVHDGYSPDRSAALFDKLPERLSRLSAVRAVTLGDAVPLGDLVAVPNARFSVPQSQAGSGHAVHSVVRQHIGAGYFATLGTPLVRGREFSQPDLRADSTAPPALLNQTAAQQLFGTDDPLGRHVQEDKQAYIIVGVVRDIRSTLLAAKPTATVFVPLSADSLRHVAVPTATVIIRGTAGPNTIAAVRDDVASLDPRLIVFNVRTMREHIADVNTMVQFGSLFYGGLGLFGLILASIGLAGVTAYAVARRRKEIGIRMALGARPAQVLRLVLKEGVQLVAVGSVFGFAGAFLVARALSSVTYELARAFDNGTSSPLLVFGAPLLLAALAMLASYLPARRSTRIDPVSSLREE